MLSKLMVRSSAGKQQLRYALKRQPQRRHMSYKVPMREIQFLMNEVYDFESHYKKLTNSGGENASPDMVDMILQESAKFAENELDPINEGGDRVGCVQMGPNEVKTPPGFKESYKAFVEGGWQGLSYPEEFGGQGLPQSLSLIQSEMTATANWTWTMAPGLSKGGINTIMAHGDDVVKKKYLEKLVSGEWTSSMALTEPHCGSDLAQVSTKAEPIGNNKYKITGTKIFISFGDHDMADNIVHCTLARLPDAPPGIKGISLFAVPKYVVSEDGELTDELNNVNVGRIEDKMGCHGSPTCELNYDGAVGELIGTPNKGMRLMFTFINTSRLGTALQGLAATERSFQSAVEYCRERGSMRALSGTKCPDLKQDPIIVHPAVRSMLLLQKAVSESGRSMLFECCLLNDLMAEAKASGDEKKEKELDDRLGFLTPILKGHLTELGLEAANRGIQAFGGHGYIKSNGQEQIVRDVRIGSIWEGTTQIQGLDLLARKVMLQKFKPLLSHLSGVRSLAFGNMFSPATTSHGRLRSHGYKLLKESFRWSYLTMRIAARATRNKDVISQCAEPYLMMAGIVAMAEHHLKMEAVAAKALANGASGEDAEFYQAKIDLAHYFFENMLPRNQVYQSQMLSPLDSLTGMTENGFGRQE